MLQSIESALDTKVLIIANNSDEMNIQRIPMNPEFRLFATQNPNRFLTSFPSLHIFLILVYSGFFKQKREKLSASFLARFLTLEFNQLPVTEWEEVVAQRLASVFPETWAKSLASVMVVQVHAPVQVRLSGRGGEKGKGRQEFRHVDHVAAHINRALESTNKF